VWAFHHYALVPGQHAPSVFRGGVWLVDIATLFVVAAAVHPISDVGRVLGCRPMRWIGVRSYSLYLWHYPIFCITRPGPASAGGDFQHFFHLTGWPVLVLRLGLSFGAADLSYRYIETPIRHGVLGKWITQNREREVPRQQVLVRTFALVMPLVLVALLLGAGLVNAKSQAVNIPGLSSASSHHVDPDEVDPAILSGLRNGGHTTTTTGRPGENRRGTSTTVLPPRTTPQTTGTTNANHLPSPVLAVGDSVMLGARNALMRDIPGIQVDAVVSRQFWDAISLMQGYARLNAIPQTVVLHLGTNGVFSDAQFDQMMNVLGPNRHVYFLTEREPRPWEAIVDARLVAGASRWKNVRIIDWHTYARDRGAWFVGDGVHLTDLGQEMYARYVLGALSKPFNRK
jgi:hypothetical protein